MSAEHEPTRGLTGRRVKRLEDPRLTAGAGRYLEALELDDLAHVALLRSPHVHARVLSINAQAAMELPGVIAVLTARELGEVGSVPVNGDFNIPEHLSLARDSMKFVGDPLVAIVAESPAIAEDALDPISVEYEVLPAVVDPQQAVDDTSVLVHPEFETNIVTTAVKDTRRVDDAFAAADRRMQVYTI